MKSGVQILAACLLVAAPVMAQGTRVVRVVDSATAKPLELVQIARSLPSVNTEAVHDRKLDMMGFYQRQKSAVAPRSAFITAEDLERWKPQMLSDIRYKTGRDIRSCLKYVDGVQVADLMGRGKPVRQGVDALVQPSEVAAMEVYRLSEAPPQYVPTLPRPVPCVLLIWLK